MSDSDFSYRALCVDRTRTAYERDQQIIIDPSLDPLGALMAKEEAELERARMGSPDSREEIEAAARAIAAGAIRELVEWLFEVRETRSAAFPFLPRSRAAIKKATVLAWVFGLEGIGTVTLSKLAEDLQCTRAALSHAANIARDKWGLTSGGSKSATARKVYAERARRVWARRKAQEASSDTERAESAV